MNLELMFALVLYSSLIASLMVILLLIIKKLLSHHFSARFIHMIWILILIRLLMPLDIENPLNVLPILPDQVQLLQYQNLLEPTGSEGNLTSPSPVKADKINATPKYNRNLLSLNIFSQIWLAGFLMLLLFSSVITIRFKYRTRYFTEVLDSEILSLVDQGRRKLEITRKIPVYTHASFKSPCITGVFKPSIYLPEDICTQVHRYQLEYVILHELAHYKRRDLIYNLGAVIAALLHWFNPLVWLAVMEMKVDREIACDAYVMEILGEPGVIPYGMTIINLASLYTNRSRAFNLVAFNETHSQVERRVNMIKKYKMGSYKISLLAILAFILIGLVTLTTVGSMKPDAKSPVNESIQGQLVLIDPAHGGEDFGASYPSNPSDPQSQLKEKDLNLDIALKLKPMLEKSGLKVAMSRQDDSTVPLDARVAWADQQDAALLVNIHNNMHFKASLNGTLTYSKLVVDEPSSNPGERAAQIIQNKLVKELGTTDLGNQAIKQKMLNEVPMPAVSTEIAFISNESDREMLKREDFRAKAAQALHDGIIEALTEMQVQKEQK